ncbi:LacI family gluconate utilization system Gnt-I transcriptional repressor [Rhodoferax ferrireducens]|uniref:LacI family gluconate utilization system Gnt-I transcriptional repressor n=1 Tax=Rhodoferax ferrireducens TaxID=192843 RepID=A0ABU2C2Z5_9BURK|nr:LacI family DNA-binding transcriptional regulator [Rhodoferax ferrireducens]MDR7375689.1 LacI family gluconate utilization system Gnt-I transcriptional repressor [Rhodoferax ferrireducens]
MTETPPPIQPPERKRRNASVTVNDVALLAGISAMTVSRAINTPDRLPPATLAKVQAAIAATGYVPNLLAGGLRSNKSRLVAALIPTLVSPVFNETVQALTSALRGYGYQLMLGQSGYAEPLEDELLGAIIGRRPDGIVLTGVVHSAEARRRLLASGIPVVETWDLSPEPIDMLVGFSHSAVAEAVCRHLHAHGRRRLAVIGGDDERAQRRSQAFVATALSLGLAEPWVQEVPAPTTLGSGRSALRDLRAQSTDFDAVFCSSDMLALGVLTEAQVLGIAVPTELAVMGFGDLAFARDLHPALTTVRIDGMQIGIEAARCIVDRVEGRAVPQRTIDIGFTIIERASV